MTQIERDFAIDRPVSWPAIFAGAATAVAAGTFLTTLAAGFGLDVSRGALATRSSLAAFTPALGAWAIAAQVIASGLGGYLAGRLRHAWDLHLDEAHFRDTAHGLVTWAVATIAWVLLAALVLGPYADRLSGAAVATGAVDLTVPAQTDRMAHIAAQSAFFIAIGMLLSALVAAAAARLGGLRSETMLVRPR
ncbi:MAG TPA: hypothetical protein VIC25_00870 [Caulobacteraceae bacterium]